MMDASVQKMSRKKKERMLAILRDEVPYEQITEAELAFLQEAVMEAIANKMLEDQKIVFEDHRTLQ